MKQLIIIGIAILGLSFTSRAASPVAPIGDDTGNYAFVQAYNSYVLADAAVNGTMKYEELSLNLLTTTTNPPMVKRFGTNGNCLTWFFENNSGAGPTDGTNEQIYAKFTLPGGWVEGSAITPRIHWSQTLTNGMPGILGALEASNVVWGLEYMWLAQGIAPTVTTLDYVTNAVSMTNWQHQVSSFAPITNATGKVYDEMLVRLFRQGTNAANTYTNAVALIKVGISMQRNKLGSTTATTK